ncbi:GGDEF domain-containing protein [Aeromonas dhakensis]|uniref:GGDEF domain-containing protein n=1 Tax=Aeromonas dhakensis TaxID=196024 RepID=UPI0021B36C11|nr:GGDEF domain-containing protein [Aeromonas dhakensis]UXB11273.1 GGDEF domain-containing protein [Aeromonas dhakensis]
MTITDPVILTELQQILFRSFDVIPFPILISESACSETLDSIPTRLSEIPARHHRFVNRAFVTQLGYDLTDLPDMASWFATVYRDEESRALAISRWNQAVMSSLASGAAVAEMNALLYCKSGQQRWFTITAQLKADAMPGWHIVTLRDIHDLHCMIEEVSRISCTDPLTELGNRRAAGQQLQALWLQGEPFSVILGDIDHFKQINDRYGHPAGDVALCEVARIMTGQLRAGEHLARWGGEEFLLILPGVDAELVVERAEQLRRQFVGHVVAWEGQSFSLTMSLGCATRSEGQSSDSLLQVADKALYQAKSNGRNQVVFGKE